MNNNQSPTANIQDKRGEIIKEALYLPPSGGAYNISQVLAKIYPQKALVKGSDRAFNVEAFARADRCTILAIPQIHNQRDTSWNLSHNEPYQTMNNGSLQIKWQENSIDLVLLSCQSDRHHWILADTQKVAENFFNTVCSWNSPIESNNEILVLQDGYLREDREY